MKRMKRNSGITALLLALVLLAGMAGFSPELVFADVNAPKTENFSWWGKPYEAAIYISVPSGKERFDPASVTSQNTAVVEIDYENMYESADTEYAYDRVCIGILIKKKGKAVVSCRVGNQTVQTKVVVKKKTAGEEAGYICPVSKLKVSNVAGGKNIAGKFKKSGYVSGLMHTDSDDAVLEIKGKRGWKVGYVYLHEDYGDFQRERRYDVKTARKLKLELGEVYRMPDGSSNIIIGFVKGSGAEMKTACLCIDMK